MWIASLASGMEMVGACNGGDKGMGGGMGVSSSSR